MDLSYWPISLELRDTFRINREASDRRDNVFVKIVDEFGNEGLGEAAPSRYYQQTANSVSQALSTISLTGVSEPFRLEDITNDLSKKLQNQRSALTAVDMAMHDLIGKRLKIPLYRLFGLHCTQVPVTSFTIGIASPDEMRHKTEGAAHFHTLKVKLGMANDREMISAIRSVTSVPLRVDANAAWTVTEAVENLKWLYDEGIELVEQPLAKNDLDGFRRLTDLSPIPIIADESVETPEDVIKLRGCVHGVNIKLNKCGGLREAFKMISIARAQEMQVMLGCFIESSLGISAAVHLSPLVDYVDLDGHLLIQNDPFRGLRLQDGKVLPTDQAGLGIQPIESSA